jgi:hypothetical protein
MESYLKKYSLIEKKLVLNLENLHQLDLIPIQKKMLKRKNKWDKKQI